MEEKHLFKSSLQYGSSRYNLSELRVNLQEFFSQEAKPVFSYVPSENHDELWGFHKDGISIHVQFNYLFEKPKPENLRFVDLILVSEVTKTLNLEERLKAIAEKSKKQGR